MPKTRNQFISTTVVIRMIIAQPRASTPAGRDAGSEGSWLWPDARAARATRVSMGLGGRPNRQDQAPEEPANFLDAQRDPRLRPALNAAKRLPRWGH